MKKMINKTHLEGYVYQHDLELKTSGPNSAHPGTQYISGNLDIMTDNDGVNIVTIHFTYTTAMTGGGKENTAYKILSDIIDGKIGSVMANGKDKAGMVRIDSAIGLNDFYNKNGELVSAKRNEGGFIHPVNMINEDENERNTFEADMVITGVRTIEADPDRNLPEKLIVKGAIFDYRNSLLPVEFSVLNPHAIAYFENLGASERNPVFTKVKGRQISEVITRQIVEDGAWGEPSIKEVKNTRKDFVITWASREPYEWDSEETITAQELLKTLGERNTYLATLKQRHDEYQASKNQVPGAFSASAGEFKF